MAHCRSNLLRGGLLIWLMAFRTMTLDNTLNEILLIFAFRLIAMEGKKRRVYKWKKSSTWKTQLACRSTYVIFSEGGIYPSHELESDKWFPGRLSDFHWWIPLFSLCTDKWPEASKRSFSIFHSPLMLLIYFLHQFLCSLPHVMPLFLFCSFFARVSFHCVSHNSGSVSPFGYIFLSLSVVPSQLISSRVLHSHVIQEHTHKHTHECTHMWSHTLYTNKRSKAGIHQSTRQRSKYW